MNVSNRYHMNFIVLLNIYRYIYIKNSYIFLKTKPTGKTFSMAKDRDFVEVFSGKGEISRAMRCDTCLNWLLHVWSCDLHI